MQIRLLEDTNFGNKGETFSISNIFLQGNNLFYYVKGSLTSTLSENFDKRVLISYNCTFKTLHHLINVICS